MSIAETFVLSVKNVFSNKMRTFLTMLGIIIGVAAVIIIVGLGNGMAAYMEESFATIGTNSLTVMITGRGGSSRSVSVDRMYDIVDGSEYLDLMSPTVSMSGNVKIGNETYGRTSVTGVSEDYFEMKDYEVDSGRGLIYMDIKDRKHVCVVGEWVNKEYFSGKALGQTLKIGADKFTIVGIMAQEADELEKGGTDDCVYVPYSTAARISHVGNIKSYTVTVADEDFTTEAKNAIAEGLYEIFEDDDAYSVIAMSEILSVMTKLLNVVITVLAIIAGISLVVGGIGIMNIMLVSVTERTREIGIRKALGAKESAIMGQFVLEASITSALGGVVGIGMGYVFSSIATKIVKAVLEVPLSVTPSTGSVLMAFGISAGIGILFGYLPAKKAAVLNPIDALRYE